MEEYALTIVVPVYNECESVEATAKRLEAVRAALKPPSEIIFVDDGSTDGTSEILKRLSGGATQVIRHAHNRGYGAAIKTGAKAARYSFVAITDADGTYPCERLAEFFEKLEARGLDMIVGARTGATAEIPLVRRPAKWCLSKLANLLTGTRIPDLNSGLRIMRKSALERFANILPDGFSLTSTITLAMLTNGYSVEYVEIEYNSRVGSSKIRPIYDTLNFVQLICRTTLYFNPLRIFMPLSGALFCLSLAVLFGSWAFLDKAMDVTFSLLFMTAVMVMAIGLLADLIDKRLQ